MLSAYRDMRIHPDRPIFARWWLLALASLVHLACGDDGSPAPGPGATPISRATDDSRHTSPGVRSTVPDAAPGPALQPPAPSASSGADPATRAPGPISSTSGRPRVTTGADAFHLDQGGGLATSRHAQPAPRPDARPATRVAAGRERPILIKLLSTPSGALAAVDGVALGRTPAFWQGDFTGKPREFTFVLPGHAMARYRFVPTTSGVVHGTLSKLERSASESMTDLDAAHPAAPAPDSSHADP